jgi:hypothetical protein
MTTQEYLCRHFARMGARVVVRGPRRLQRTKIAIDVRRDRSGEVFVIGCEGEVAIEVLDVQSRSHQLVLMVREASEKHKFLLGRDERHWFAAAVPGDGVRDVRTAIASLRPTEIEGREAIRQGEWFFVPEPGVNDKNAVVLRNEPLSRGGGSKPHVCAQMMRKGGEAVMVCSRYPTGIDIGEYQKLTSRSPNALQFGWRRMVRDPELYARGDIRHRDHKTIDLRCWHRVFMNRERFAKHAPQIAFLD